MSKDFQVREEDSVKRVIYLVKEFLKEGQDVNVSSSQWVSHTLCKSVNALVNMNYAVVKDFKTMTEVKNGRRRIFVTMKLSKTSEFDKLYKENQERRAQFIAEKEKQQELSTKK